MEFNLTIRQFGIWQFVILKCKEYKMTNADLRFLHFDF